jgi:hypothetical protein
VQISQSFHTLRNAPLPVVCGSGPYAFLGGQRYTDKPFQLRFLAERKRKSSGTPTLICISLTPQDVLRIYNNHGKLTLELYRLEGANVISERVFITDGDQDHLVLGPKEKAALVVGDHWVRLPWVSGVI